jgi:hypothetical protein
MVVMGAGALRLADAWEIGGDFRIKVETEDRLSLLMPQSIWERWVRQPCLGRVELRMSGIVAALSVDLNADGLAAAGADFSLDAFLAVNTGEEEATITSDTNPRCGANRYSRRQAASERPENSRFACRKPPLN